MKTHRRRPQQPQTIVSRFHFTLCLGCVGTYVSSVVALFENTDIMSRRSASFALTSAPMKLGTLSIQGETTHVCPTFTYLLYLTLTIHSRFAVVEGSGTALSSGKCCLTHPCRRVYVIAMPYYCTRLIHVTIISTSEI